MAIVDLRTGKTLTAREIKASVMKSRGWTSEEYQKQYDILRNKTRNYEKLSGTPSGSIKVNELLYTQTKAQKRYGAAYRPSKQLQAIEATPSAGTAKFAKQGASRAVISKQEKILKSQFSGFTSKSAEGREILESYERQKTGYYETRAKELREDIATLGKIDDAAEKLKAAKTRGDKAAAASIRKELRELSKQLNNADMSKEELSAALSGTIEAQASAPKNLAELRQQLDSAAKSLRTYQKTKANEWKRKNPDAPASYAVGTP